MHCTSAIIWIYLKKKSPMTIKYDKSNHYLSCYSRKKKKIQTTLLIHEKPEICVSAQTILGHTSSAKVWSTP